MKVASHCPMEFLVPGASGMSWGQRPPLLQTAIPGCGVNRVPTGATAVQGGIMGLITHHRLS